MKRCYLARVRRQEPEELELPRLRGHWLILVVQVLPETSITIILVRCCIGSLSGLFPLGLDKNIPPFRVGG